ncbi:MAG: ATP synthase subunit I [Gammaproteobacteria bacterium]
MKVAYRLLFIQLTIAILATLVWMLLSGSQAGKSALAAGVCSVLPGLVFAIRLFAYSGARAANKIVTSFYRGEMLKIATTVVLFVLCIKYLHVEFLPFMVTFVLCQMAYWLGLKNKVISA